jgi:hypothetical protein
LNALDIEAHQRYMLKQIADHAINRMRELLPWNVCLAHPADAPATR